MMFKPKKNQGSLIPVVLTGEAEIGPKQRIEQIPVTKCPLDYLQCRMSKPMQEHASVAEPSLEHIAFGNHFYRGNGSRPILDRDQALEDLLALGETSLGVGSPWLGNAVDRGSLWVRRGSWQAKHMGSFSEICFREPCLDQELNFASGACICIRGNFDHRPPCCPFATKSLLRAPPGPIALTTRACSLQLAGSHGVAPVELDSSELPVGTPGQATGRLAPLESWIKPAAIRSPPKFQSWCQRPLRSRVHWVARHLCVSLPSRPTVRMPSFSCKALAVCAILPLAAQAQQPYHDWDKAYEAASELVASWTIAQRANITIRDGVAPGYTPFTPTDGMTPTVQHHIQRTFMLPSGD